MTIRSPCVRCGMLLSVEPRAVTVTFTVVELIDLVWDVHNGGPEFDTRPMINRLLCAAELLDADKVRETREQLAGCRP